MFKLEPAAAAMTVLPQWMSSEPFWMSCPSDWTAHFSSRLSRRYVSFFCSLLIYFLVVRLMALHRQTFGVSVRSWYSSHSGWHISLYTMMPRYVVQYLSLFWLTSQHIIRKWYVQKLVTIGWTTSLGSPLEKRNGLLKLKELHRVSAIHSDKMWVSFWTKWVVVLTLLTQQIRNSVIGSNQVSLSKFTCDCAEKYRHGNRSMEALGEGYLARMAILVCFTFPWSVDDLLNCHY